MSMVFFLAIGVLAILAILTVVGTVVYLLYQSQNRRKADGSRAEGEEDWGEDRPADWDTADPRRKKEPPPRA